MLSFFFFLHSLHCYIVGIWHHYSCMFLIISHFLKMPHRDTVGINASALLLPLTKCDLVFERSTSIFFVKT